MDPAKPSYSRSYKLGVHYEGEERESSGPKNDVFKTPFAKREGNRVESVKNHAIGTPPVKCEIGSESLLNDINVPSTYIKRELGMYCEGEKRESSVLKNDVFKKPFAKREGNQIGSVKNHAIGNPPVKCEFGAESLSKDANVPSTMDGAEPYYMRKGKNKTPLHELGIFVEPFNYPTANLQTDRNQPRSSTSDLNIQDVLEQINAPLIPRESGSANSQMGARLLDPIIQLGDPLPNPIIELGDPLPNPFIQMDAPLPNPIIPEDSKSASLPIGASLPSPNLPRPLGNPNLPIGASLMHPTLNTRPTVIVRPIDITSDHSRGVLKVISRDGTGLTPAYGDKVAIHYDAYLIVRGNKVPFASDRRQECTKFNLGRGEVIRGWDLAVSTMKKGESSFFIVTPDYAYGAMGMPPHVPPNASLLVHIDLCDWNPEDLSIRKDGTILRRVLVKGEGPTYPNDGSKVKVQLFGRYNGQIFDQREVIFTLGEGCDASIPGGIEKALYKFQLNERSLIHLKDTCGFEEYGIPPKSSVTYEVKLLSFEKVKDVWEMNSAEKLERAVVSKQRGIDYTKVNNFKVALKHFKWIITCLENEPGVDRGTEKERKDLLLSGYLNIALCLLKLENYNDAIKFCDKVLKVQPNNEKALFRRGQAKMGNNDSEEAMQDFIAVCKLYPDNKAARNLVFSCQVQIQKQKEKDTRVYGNMFDTFVKQDQERMKNMETETGVWQNENGAAEVQRVLSETEMLIEQNNSLLRDANIIELSSNVCKKI